MPLLSPATLLSVLDAVATAISQAYQLARVRLASAASPVLKLVCQRDHALNSRALLRRELKILRGQRANMPLETGIESGARAGGK